MTQHITQEQATELAVALPGSLSSEAFMRALCNSAIQRYIDQQPLLNDYVDKCIKDHMNKLGKELPVLPEPYFGSGRYLGVAGLRGAYTPTQIQSYGLQCAVHARELALSEAKDVILGFQAGRVPDGFTEYADFAVPG